MTIDGLKCTTDSETTQNGLNRKGLDWLLLLVQDYSFLSSRMRKRQNFKKVDGQKFSLLPPTFTFYFLSSQPVPLLFPVFLLMGIIRLNLRDSLCKTHRMYEFYFKKGLVPS